MRNGLASSTGSSSGAYENQAFKYHIKLIHVFIEFYYTLFLHNDVVFNFRARLNIPIFLPILAWKYSCIILEL